MPRGAVVWNATDSNTIALAAGMYATRAEGYKYTEGLGNPQIADELSEHYALTWTHRNERFGSIAIEPYYKTLRELAIPDDERGYINAGSGWAYGLDVSWRLRLHDVTLLASYAFQRSDRQLDHQDPEEYRFYQEVPHTLQASVLYRFSERWTASALMQYHSGKPFTPIVGTYEFIDDDGSTRLRPLYGRSCSDRLPGFFTLNLKTAYARPVNWGESLEMAFEIINATAHENVMGIEYDDEYQKEDYVTGIPFVPNFSITWHW
jgi:hypothetical protein